MIEQGVSAIPAVKRGAMAEMPLVVCPKKLESPSASDESEVRMLENFERLGNGSLRNADAFERLRLWGCACRYSSENERVHLGPVLRKAAAR